MREEVGRAIGLSARKVQVRLPLFRPTSLSHDLLSFADLVPGKDEVFDTIKLVN